MEAEKGVSIKQYSDEEVDDDGRIKRTGMHAFSIFPVITAFHFSISFSFLAIDI